eukprot:12892063-Prorocentrum_lima.AAC.1
MEDFSVMQAMKEVEQDMILNTELLRCREGGRAERAFQGREGGARYLLEDYKNKELEKKQRNDALAPAKAAAQQLKQQMK